jgi:hypothetical protein
MKSPYVGLFVLLAACGGVSERPAGKTLLLSGEDRALPAPEIRYTLGSADGPAWKSFTHLAHAAFDAEDNLYVLDRGAGKVLVYDTTGQFLREMGRTGHGPGELTFPVQVAVTQEGTVVVSDLRRNAFVLFDRQGRYQRDYPFAFKRSLGGLELRSHPQSGFVAIYQPIPALKPDTGHLRLVWHSLGGTAPRILATVPSSPERMGAGTMREGQPAFSPGFYWGVLPSGGVAISSTGSYRVDVFGAGGDLVRTLERPIEPRRVTAGDREAEREKRLAYLKEHGVLPPAIRHAAMREMAELKFSRMMPVIQDFGVDPAGRIWLRRGMDAAGTGGTIDLVSSGGSYLGTIPGERLPTAYSRRGFTATIDEDSLGVQRITVRRLPDNWASPDRGNRSNGV